MRRLATVTIDRTKHSCWRQQERTLSSVLPSWFFSVVWFPVYGTAAERLSSRTYLKLDGREETGEPSKIAITANTVSVVQ